MKPLTRHLCLAFVAVFVVAGTWGLRHDLALVSLSTLARSWDLVLLAALCSLLNYALRILRWQRYLARLGTRLPLGFTSLTYIAGFAFTVSPGKVGEMARARYYSPLGIRLSDVAGAFCVERLMDLVAMVALAALILTAVPRFDTAIWLGAGLIAAVLVALTVLPWASIAAAANRRSAAAADASRAAVLTEKLAHLGAGIARTLATARALLRPGPLLAGFFLGLVAWALEGVGLWILGGMFGPTHLSVELGVGIYAVAVLVGALSFLPGGVGGTEAVMTALLAAQGFPIGDAFAVTIVCRVVTLWLAVCMGWLALFALRRRWVPAEV